MPVGTAHTDRSPSSFTPSHATYGTVFRPLTEGAPTLDAIVSESVGSCAVASDVDQFYSGRENRKRIVKDLLSFAEIETMSSVVMREYILGV